MTKVTVGFWMVATFLVVFAVELVGKRYGRGRFAAKDALFALGGFTATIFAWPPVIGLGAGLILNLLSPATSGRLAGAPFWAIFPAWFLAESFSHYWYHRKAHEWEWLWRVHRGHHSAAHLNVAVLYRNNIFFSLMQPGSWFGAAAVHLGLVEVFAACTLIDWTVNLLTHTTYRWDLALRQIPGLNPVFNVVEKIITLPDTHHAHHGRGQYANVAGNYAATLFFYDVLMGTARIPHARQEAFGLADEVDWREELAWPLFRKRAPAIVAV